MKLLFITPRITVRHSSLLIKSLAKLNHSIDVLAYQTNEFWNETESDNVNYITLPFKNNRIKNVLNLLLLKPFAYSTYRTKSFEKKMKMMVFREKYEYIIFCEFPMIQYAELISKTVNSKIVFFPADALSRQKQLSLKFKKGYQYLFGYIDFLLNRLMEMRYLKKSNTKIFLSSEDISYYTKKIENVYSIGHIVETFDNVRITNNSYGKYLLFHGNLSDEKNVKSICFFINHVFKKLLLLLPDVKLVIAGSFPDKRLFNHKNGSIFILPNVKSFLSLIINSQLVISPLLYGAGVKYRVIESMALGKVVVGSRISFDGIQGGDKLAYFICENPVEYIDVLYNLLINAQKIVKIEAEAILQVNKVSNEICVVNKFCKILNEIR